MGNQPPKRCPNGPGSSRAPKLFEPDTLEIIDFESKSGIVRAFWLRKDLLNAVVVFQYFSIKLKKTCLLNFQKTPLVMLHGWGCGSGYFHKLNPFLARDRGVNSYYFNFRH